MVEPATDHVTGFDLPFDERNTVVVALPDQTPVWLQRDLIGYGARPPKVVWPDGALVAVNIAVNYEEGAEASVARGDDYNDPGAEVHLPRGDEFRDLYVESCFEYGSRVGIWRLLNLFAEYRINATIFGCGMAFEQNPEAALAMTAGGHDVCAHGYRWSRHWQMSESEEREEIARAVESITRVSGQRPLGWYSRYSASLRTRELLMEEGGFIYDSDAYNDDLPYFVDVTNGSRQLIIPYTFTYNDFRFILPTGSFGSPSDFVDYLKRGFDELRREGAAGYPKVMSIGLHPRWAQAGRVSAVREFIEHALGVGNVWFAPRSEIAKWWLAHHEEFSR